MFAALRERIFFARYSVVHKGSLKSQFRWQSKRFSELIAHAYRNVPLWKRLLEEKKLMPREVTLDGIAALPISSKRTYLSKTADEYTDNSRRLAPNWYKTSGSSGTPFSFLLSDRVLNQKYVDFGSLRFLWWLGVPPQRFSTVKMVRIRLRPRTASRSLFIGVEDYLRNPEKAISSICHFKPLILATYPSILSDIARIVSSRNDVTWEPPPFLISLGETLLPTVRKHVAKVLKSEIYDHYGIEEIGAVAVECSAHDGLHINTESVFVEIVDEFGMPVSEGKEGRVIVTDLFNFNMPFIRYDDEDRGYMSTQPCKCGLQAPRIWVKGRNSAVLQFSGRLVHHLEFDGAMDGFMNAIAQYQIVKKSERKVVIKIVPGVAYREDVVNAIKDNVRALVGETIEISIESISNIALSGKGKCQIVIDESQE